jgi:cathepsin F
LVVLALVCSVIAHVPDDDLVKFRDFIQKYNKHYANSKEFNERFQIFKSNLRKIDARNAVSTTSYHNVTKFSDMTVEEFRSYPCGVPRLGDLTPLRPDFQINMGELPEESDAVPDSWDWTTKGAVTGVKDQGQCGSCWAFSTIANMEGVWFLAGKALTGLSEEQVVDCSTTDYGCEGGWPFWAMADMDAAPYSGGIDSEAAYPYTAEDGNSGSCVFQASNVAATEKTYQNFCNEQTNPCTMNQIQQLLVKNGPLSACLDATPMQSYSGGIDNPQDCDPTAIDHCITLVGYGTQGGTPFWKIKNSWGTGWGESGYYYLYRDSSNQGQGVCGINKVITTAIVSS